MCIDVCVHTQVNVFVFTRKMCLCIRACITVVERTDLKLYLIFEELPSQLEEI